MSLIVMKFGGTSLETSERIRQSACIVERAARQDSVVVVVSALAGVTDSILGIVHAARLGGAAEVESQCRELEARHEEVVATLFQAETAGAMLAVVHAVTTRLREICSGLLQLRACTPQVMDMALSMGEEISAQVLTAYLRHLNLVADYVDAARVLVTDERYGEAIPDLEATRHLSREVLAPLLNSGHVTVVTGYRGATTSGHLTTLGRGGSDYSATILGAAINADEVWIWTDVNGVLTADPRICPEAAILSEITFAEAIELSYYGAKVLHQHAIRPCMHAGIPVRIKNSFQPEAAGTKITAATQAGCSPVKAITTVTRASVVTLRARGDAHFGEVFGRLFLRLAHEHVDVLFSTQSSSENAIGLVLREPDTEHVLRAIKRLFRTEFEHGVLNPVTVERDVAVIAVLGQAMKGTPGILSRLFLAVARCGVSVIAVAQGASEINICFAVPAASSATVVQAVHSEFFPGTGPYLPAAPAPDDGLFAPDRAEYEEA